MLAGGGGGGQRMISICAGLLLGGQLSSLVGGKGHGQLLLRLVQGNKTDKLEGGLGGASAMLGKVGHVLLLLV